MGIMFYDCLRMYLDGPDCIKWRCLAVSGCTKLYKVAVPNCSCLYQAVSGCTCRIEGWNCQQFETISSQVTDYLSKIKRCYRKWWWQCRWAVTVVFGAWLDPGALGDTGGSIFHSVRREITQEYASCNLLYLKIILSITPNLNA